MDETAVTNEKSERLIFTHLELLLVVAIWAGTFVSTKIVLTQISPATSALYRYLIASAILIALNIKNRERVERSDYPALLLLGATGVTLYYLLQHYGIQYTNAIDAAILVSLSPVFIGVIAWIWLKERFRLVSLAGLLLALGGAMLVISNGELSGEASSSRLYGNLLILLTAVSWAIYSTAGKKLLKKYSSLTLITYTTLIGTALLIPFSLAEFSGPHRFTLDAVGWLHMLYLGGAASVYGYLAWYRALTRLPPVTVGSYLYFRPLLTGIIAAIVLNEKVGLAVVIGGILIILGTYLSQRT